MCRIGGAEADKAVIVCGKWSHTEMRAYFDGVGSVANYPIYRRSDLKLDSPMNFLVAAVEEYHSFFFFCS